MSLEFPVNPTPRNLWKAYSEGFVGSKCNPEDVARLLGELPHPVFGAAAHALKKVAKERSLYRSNP